MDIFTGIIVFLLVWWTALFLVLPWGLERDENGTPKAPKLKKKALITTMVSFCIWLLLYVLIESDMISFREMALGLT